MAMMMMMMKMKSRSSVMLIIVALVSVLLAAVCIEAYPIDDSADVDHEELHSPDPSKTWPELVGKTGEEARDAILAEYPTLEVELIPIGWPLTIDFRPNRVRILLCERGLVQNPPYIG